MQGPHTLPQSLTLPVFLSLSLSLLISLQPGCDFKAKQPGNLTKHKMVVHDIGVVWRHCDFPGCDYKARYVYALKEHQKKHVKKEAKLERIMLEDALRQGYCGICNSKISTATAECNKCKVNVREKISVSKARAEEQAKEAREAREARNNSISIKTTEPYQSATSGPSESTVSSRSSSASKSGAASVGGKVSTR